MNKTNDQQPKPLAQQNEPFLQQNLQSSQSQQIPIPSLISNQQNESSQDQKPTNQIIKSAQPVQSHMVNVLSMIQQSQPAQKKNLKADSLQHDIKLGWIPKTQITGPIPVSFSHNFLDAVIEQKVQQKKIIYLGYRPTNTFEIHQKFYESGNKYPFYQFHLCKSQFLERFFKKYYSGYQFTSERKVGMIELKKVDSQQGSQQPEPTIIPKHLTFTSQFEGGNLDAVYYEQDEYRLMIRVDSNTKGHCNFYNFQITCLKSGLYKFRIMNMSKKKSLYERGLKPYIKILTKNPKIKAEDEFQQRDQTMCPKVKFGPSPLNEFLEDGGQFYSLKFQLELKNQTQYQISYNIPYTYSQLIQMISNIRQHKNLHVNKLGYSLSGVEIPIFTISQNQDRAEEDQQTQKEENSNYFVVVTGRIHPGESNGSHIVNGLVKFLLKDLAEYKKFKKNIVFKIIPMLNPDGVICGNTRTGFAGKDLNRKFSGKSEFIFPEVNNLRDYVMKLKEKHGKRLLFVIDIHGHSNRKGSFFFGPEYPILDEEYTKCRLLPRLYAARSEAFRYYSCKFKISSGKEATSRGYFNSNGVRTYTHETSIHSYYDFRERKDLPFTRKTLENLGKDLALAILDYVQKIRIYAARQKSQPKNIVVVKKDQEQKEVEEIRIDQPKEQERDSDKMPSEKADSESQGDDIDQKQLNVFYQKINENREYFYEEILKNMKNSKQPSKSPAKQKPKAKQLQKEKQRQKQTKKQPQKKQKPKWTTKVTYTPKKTLFDQYSKGSNATVSKSTTFRTTNSQIPKMNTDISPQAILKRQNQQKETQDILMSFQRVKLQGNSNRIIYSVPNIKWDYANPKPTQALPHNQIYRYDLNDYSHVELPNKKDKNRQTRHMSNTQTLEKSVQKDDRRPKINRELLQQLLRPSTNMLVNQQKIINESKLISLKDKKEPKPPITSLINEKMFTIYDIKKGMSLSEMKRRASIMQEVKKQKVQAEVGPQIQTKKEEYLCKKWEKQIVLKTKRSYSLSNKMLYSETKVPIVNVGKNLGSSVTQTYINKQPLKKQILPKINFTKKDIIVIQHTDSNSS